MQLGTVNTVTEVEDELSHFPVSVCVAVMTSEVLNALTVAVQVPELTDAVPMETPPR